MLCVALIETLMFVCVLVSAQLHQCVMHFICLLYVTNSAQSTQWTAVSKVCFIIRSLLMV